MTLLSGRYSFTLGFTAQQLLLLLLLVFVPHSTMNPGYPGRAGACLSPVTCPIDTVLAAPQIEFCVIFLQWAGCNPCIKCHATECPSALLMQSFLSPLRLCSGLCRWWCLTWG